MEGFVESIIEEGTPDMMLYAGKRRIESTTIARARKLSESDFSLSPLCFQNFFRRQKDGLFLVFCIVLCFAWKTREGEAEEKREVMMIKERRRSMNKRFASSFPQHEVPSNV